ncbi:MAG: hypothetical protein ACLT9S_01165 [Faecalibacterium sp.]
MALNNEIDPKREQTTLLYACNAALAAIKTDEYEKEASGAGRAVRPLWKGGNDMADPTKAEIMLDQVTKINALIRRFQLCKDHPIPPLRLDLWPSTKSTIKALSGECRKAV